MRNRDYIGYDDEVVASGKQIETVERLKKRATRVLQSYVSAAMVCQTTEWTTSFQEKLVLLLVNTSGGQW